MIDAVQKIKEASFTGGDGLDYVETLVALDALKSVSEQEPCGDAISRQAVLDQTYLWSKDEFLRVTNPFDYLRKRINSLPSVTPQPKIGHWIRDTITDLYHCSECRSIIHQGPKSKDDYCRYCGAKMAESEVEV